MPSLDSTENQCIADFNLRKETRLDFPGACSLNFQSVMQIILEVLIGWDPDKQKSSEDGIFGELDAWGMTVEEQARKTLHSHWLLWSKKLAKMRNELFDDIEEKRAKAREDFCARVDDVMSASYTATEWIVEHKCGAKGKVSEVFKECGLQDLRDARHKVLCQDIKGKVMKCKECDEKVSTQDIINLALNEWHQNALKDGKTSAKDLTFPLSKERHDIAMYRTLYDMTSGYYEDDKFWGNEDVRRILQLSGDNEHHALHGPRCFKKGHECTSGSFPQAECPSTCIHRDLKIGKGVEMLEWYLLNGEVKKTAPWMILPRRPLGCQYLNTHNKTISTIFSCNSNVIIGDASNTFYLTCYSSKSTQTEDKDKKERIVKKLIRRMKRLQMEKDRDPNASKEDGDYVLGLSMAMSAINASTSRDVVSSPMAHYLVAKGGDRFSASHKPKHLLIHQMEETLDGKAVNYTLRRTNKSKADGTTIQWPDSSSHDYLHRPFELELMCAYEFTELYGKQFYSLKEVENDKQDAIAEGTRYRFTEDHPGREFAYIEKLEFPAVAVVSLPKGRLCLLKELELQSDTPTDTALSKREDYAKIALMMFYPFRSLDDLSDIVIDEDSTVVSKRTRTFWPTFRDELARYTEGRKTDKFWEMGFEILQNIEDREMMMKTDRKMRAEDPVQMKTKMHVDETKEQQKKDIDNSIPDVSQIYDEGLTFAESDIEEEEEEVYGNGKQWSHSLLLEKAKHITSERLISARLTSTGSILSETDSSQMQENTATEGNAGDEFSDWFRTRTYPTLIKLISGALVGATVYDDIYEDDVMDNDSPGDEDVDDGVNVITQEDISIQEDTSCIPTLVGLARKTAREDNTKLDEKQYIAYEIIACTFLLQPVAEGRDKSSILGQYLGSAVGSTTTNDMDQLVRHLKARGGMEQLIMFLTGPAGAGKSTAVKVAEKFCFEFCTAVSVMWHDETFYFTACSGSAAAIFGGITIHSAIMLNRKITDKARQAWKARILVVDEISYYSDNDLKKTDRKLKDLNGVPHKPFGGQSIIFCGDFRQLEAIKAKHLLYDRNGSQLWESSINCVIILENIHRFKDDPEFGEMLTRFWRDDLTKEDREKINTRVVGHNGIALPSTFEGDVVYACSTNKERNAVQAGIFRNHILRTHPTVHNPDLPPDHTIIIEAIVQSSKSRKAASISVGKFTRDRIIHTCGDADVSPALAGGSLPSFLGNGLVVSTYNAKDSA